jgi:hypothetical protein
MFSDPTPLQSVSMASADSVYVQTNLVSDISGLAEVTDPSLVNSWGVSFLPGSPFWVSDQGTNVSTLYSVTDSTTVSKVDINPPTGFVAIPTTTTGPKAPPARSPIRIRIPSYSTMARTLISSSPI